MRARLAYTEIAQANLYTGPSSRDGFCFAYLTLSPVTVNSYTRVEGIFTSTGVVACFDLTPLLLLPMAGLEQARSPDLDWSSRPS